MKKSILLLAVLVLAMPALAAVVFSIVDEGGDVVAINYVSDANVSAFALEISVADGNTIDDINDYFVGECDDGGQGYGIFLDKVTGIDIDGDDESPTYGEVLNYGSPVIDGNSPDGTGTGFGADAVPASGSTDTIIIEMGALYEDGNEPGLSGTLCKITVSGSTTVTIAANATRGNVVLADATEASTNLPISVPVGSSCPFSPAECNDWDAFGNPDCWLYPNQCYGDSDGLTQGSIKVGYYHVGTNDLDLLMLAWMVKEPTKGLGILTVPNGICADFAHDQQGSIKVGYYRVGTNDLDILMANWMIKNPTKGPGMPGDCGGTLEPE